MRESDTYLAILDEGAEIGAAREARKLILRQGHQRLGPPTEAVMAALTAITDLERLECVIDRLLQARDWQDLLNTP